MAEAKSLSRRNLIKAGVAGGGASVLALAGGLSAEAAGGGVETGGLWGTHSGNTIPVGPIVKTTRGRVEGLYVGETETFLGIPYGETTAGANRFLPPVPARGWNGVLPVKDYGPSSPQNDDGIWYSPVIGEYMAGGKAQTLIDADIVQGESCLVLNVLTPRSRRGGSSRPVIVYFHGGGYATGTGSVEALATDFAADQDVVFVTVNHRLNAFGFLYLGGIDSRYSAGNVGFLDLVESLKWVKREIKAFGGDPNNVTIMGESGGGGKVLNLMAMPQAKGLFHKAIVESSVGMSWQSPANATATTQALMSKLGLAPNDVAGLLRVPPRRIVSVAATAPANNFGPVLDGVTVAASSWQTAAPAQVSHVPLLIGNTGQETTIFIGPSAPQLFTLTWEQVAPELIARGTNPATTQAAVDVYRAARPDDSPSDVFFRINSDRGFGRTAENLANLKAAQSARVYRYYFDWDTPLGNGDDVRSFHTAELPLATGLVYLPQSQRLSDHLSAAWAAFARTGNPSAKGFPKWPAYRTTGAESERFATMKFNIPTSSASANFRAAEKAALATL